VRKLPDISNILSLIQYKGTTMKISAKHLTFIAVASLGSSITATSVAANPMPERFHSSTALNVLEKPLPIYPRRAEALAIEGYTQVEFTVLPDGTVAEPVVAETSHQVFGVAAAKAVEAWKFEPVLEGDTAIPVRTSLKFSFVGTDTR